MKTVALNVNKDGSADVGKYQIYRRYHGAELARVKLDVIGSEAGNEAFARYLHKLHGTRDWNASRSCWDR